MRDPKRFAIVITHTGMRRDLLDMDWLEKDYLVDESDWIVLSRDGWRAVARGDAPVWEALQRKLLIGLYVSEPELIAVIGHPLGGSADAERGRDDVARIVRRIRSLVLPTAVMGFWTDANGRLTDVMEPARPAPAASADAAREQGEPAV